MAFDVITPTRLGQGAISVSPTVDTIYTAPIQTKAMVKDIDLSNTTASTISVTVYLVDSGGSPSASNTLIPSMQVPAKGMIQWTGAQILNAGGTIRTTASAAGVTINVSGAEFV